MKTKQECHNILKHQEIISFANGGTIKYKYINTFIGYINENKIVLKKCIIYSNF